MKIVIDIDEKDYQSIKNGHIPFSVLDVLMKGTPLPEHHGRLIDADDLKRELINKEWITNYDGGGLENIVDDAPTIIERSEN